MKRLGIICGLAALLAGCASANSEFLKKNTSVKGGGSEKNLKIDEGSWKHDAMSGIATYTAYCKDKKFYCSQRANFQYECSRAND